jgi:hypothetical protein
MGTKLLISSAANEQHQSLAEPGSHPNHIGLEKYGQS